MSDWLKYSPDWGDSDRIVELLAADGSVSQGTLFIDDVGIDEDGEEYPFWKVRIGEQELWLHDFQYRFLSPKRQWA